MADIELDRYFSQLQRTVERTSEREDQEKAALDTFLIELNRAVDKIKQHLQTGNPLSVEQTRFALGSFFARTAYEKLVRIEFNSFYSGSHGADVFLPLTEFYGLEVKTLRPNLSGEAVRFLITIKPAKENNR